MQEALRTAIEFAFENLNLTTIVAYSRADNLKSISLLTKCDFINTDKTDGNYLLYRLRRKTYISNHWR
jgi:RimJ/RimL family protein N-acetyltransferase